MTDTTCPECKGTKGYEQHELCMGCPGPDIEGHDHPSEWIPCRVCHGTGKLDGIARAVYMARGGAAPAPFRGYS